MFSCDQILAELSNLLDDEIAPDLRRALEDHLAHCRTCTAIFDSSRRTLRLVTEAGAFELPDGVSERLLARLRARLPTGPGRR